MDGRPRADDCVRYSDAHCMDRPPLGDHWSKEKIEAGRANDRQTKERYYAIDNRSPQPDEVTGVGKLTREESRNGFWSWLSKWWSR